MDLSKVQKPPHSFSSVNGYNSVEHQRVSNMSLVVMMMVTLPPETAHSSELNFTIFHIVCCPSGKNVKGVDSNFVYTSKLKRGRNH